MIKHADTTEVVQGSVGYRVGRDGRDAWSKSIYVLSGDRCVLLKYNPLIPSLEFTGHQPSLDLTMYFSRFLV